MQKIAQATPWQGDISKPADWQTATDYITAGAPLGIDNYTVHALLADGGNPQAVTTTYAIKGRARHVPLSLMMPHQRLLPYIDLAAIAPDVRALIANPQAWSDQLGGLAFVQYPITQQTAAALPPNLTSQSATGKTLIQNYDPTGKVDIAQLTDIIQQNGVELLTITSLNRSQAPPIIDPSVAQDFYQTYTVPSLADFRPLDQRLARGSYAILSAPIETGAPFLLTRAGNIATSTLAAILQHNVVADSHTKPASSQTTVFDHRRYPNLQALTGPALRQAMLAFFGWDTLAT